MNISKEDRELIRKFEQIMNKGHYVQSQQLTDAYNRILDKHVHNTTCGSCLRQRTKELIDALNNVERREARELEFAQNSGFSTVEEARRESEIIMQEIEERKKAHEEAAKKAIEEAKEQEVGNLPEEEKEANTEQIKEVQSNINDEPIIEEVKEEANNGTEGKSSTTTKKRKTSKPETT